MESPESRIEEPEMACGAGGSCAEEPAVLVEWEVEELSVDGICGVY